MNSSLMEKNMTWESNTPNRANWQSEIDVLKQTSVKVTSLLLAPIEWLRKYYAGIFEKEITMRQTLLLINAQVAFFAAAFPVDSPLWVRLACCVWLLNALRCLKGM